MISSTCLPAFTVKISGRRALSTCIAPRVTSSEFKLERQFKDLEAEAAGLHE